MMEWLFTEDGRWVGWKRSERGYEEGFVYDDDPRIVAVPVPDPPPFWIPEFHIRWWYP